MAGTFFGNPKQYINLLTTTEDCINIFPADQARYNWDFTDIPDGDWTCEVEWVTVVVDQCRFDNENEPNFAGSLVIGYFEGSSQNFGSTQDICFPANMYTGPILPASEVNIPITIVNIQWTKNNGETFNRQILAIQNWEPGVEIGDPTLDDNFIPIEVAGVALNTATVILELLEPVTIYEQTFKAKLICDVPSAFLYNAKAKFYAKTSTSSYKLVYEGTWTTITEGVNVSEVNIPTYWGPGDARNLPPNDYTIRGEWPGRRTWVKRFSNTGTQKVIDGIPLNVIVNPAPIVSNQIGQNITITASATTASGYAVFTTTNIANTVTFTIQGTSTYAALTGTRIISTTTFVGNNISATATAILNITDDLVESIPNANSTFTLITGTVVDNVFTGTALISRTFPVDVRWNAYKPSLIGSGSTSTTLTVSTTRNFTIILQSLIVETNERYGVGSYTTSTDFKLSLPSITNNIYNYPPYNLVADPLRRGPVVRATIKNSNTPLTNSTVTFTASYSPDSTGVNPIITVLPSVNTSTFLLRSTGVGDNIKDYSIYNANLTKVGYVFANGPSHYGINSITFRENQIPPYENWQWEASYITSNSQPVFDKAFTIECWMTINSDYTYSTFPKDYFYGGEKLLVGSNNWFIKLTAYSIIVQFPGFYRNQTVNACFGVGGAENGNLDSFPVGSKFHLAIVREWPSGNVKLYVNGVYIAWRDGCTPVNLISTSSWTSGNLQIYEPRRVSVRNISTQFSIAELRITNTAVYQGLGFQLPTALLTNINIDTQNTFFDSWQNYETFESTLIKVESAWQPVQPGGFQQFFYNGFFVSELPPLLQYGDTVTIDRYTFTVRDYDTNLKVVAVGDGPLPSGFNYTSFYGSKVKFTGQIQSQYKSSAKWLGYNANTNTNWTIFGENKNYNWIPGSGTSKNWGVANVPNPCEISGTFGRNVAPFNVPLFRPGIGFTFYHNVISTNFGLQGYAELFIPDDPRFYYRFNALPQFNLPNSVDGYLGTGCPYFIWSSPSAAKSNKGIKHFIRAVNYETQTVVATNGQQNAATNFGFERVGGFIDNIANLVWRGEYWTTPAGPRGKYYYIGEDFSKPFNEPENIGQWAEFFDGSGQSYGTYTAQLILGKSISNQWTTSTAYPNELYQTLDVTLNNNLVDLTAGQYQIYAAYDYNNLSELVRTPVGRTTVPLQLNVYDPLPITNFATPTLTESGNNFVFTVQTSAGAFGQTGVTDPWLKDCFIEIRENNVLKGSGNFNYIVNGQTTVAIVQITVPKNQFTTVTNVVGFFNGSVNNYRPANNFPKYAAGTFTFIVPTAIDLKSNIVITNNELTYNSNNTLQALVSGTWLGPGQTPEGFVRFQGTITNAFTNLVINQTATIVNGVASTIMNTSNLSLNGAWNTATITASYISTNNFPSTSTTKALFIDPPNPAGFTDQIWNNQNIKVSGTWNVVQFDVSSKNYYDGGFYANGIIDVKLKPGSYDPAKINLFRCKVGNQSFQNRDYAFNVNNYGLSNWVSIDKRLFVVAGNASISNASLIAPDFVRFTWNIFFETAPINWSDRFNISNTLLRGRMIFGYSLYYEANDAVFNDQTNVLFTGLKVLSATGQYPFPPNAQADSISFSYLYPYNL